MIAMLGLKPAIKVGRFLVTHYQDEWLREALNEAAKEAGVSATGLGEDIILAFNYWLEHDCPLRVLSLSEFYAHLRKALIRVGWRDVAERLSEVPPNIEFDVQDLAEREKMPLFFFSQLIAELEELRKAGVYSIEFLGVPQAAETICPIPKDRVTKRKKAEVEFVQVFQTLENLLRKWQTV